MFKTGIVVAFNFFNSGCFGLLPQLRHGLGDLPVRFYYNGEFLNDGKKLHYCGGSVAMSYIERDKVSLPEVVGHLKDHCVVTDGTLLHWLVPRKDLTTGLRAMVDDKTCLDMARTIEEGCVAEIYVEAAAVQDLSDDERAMNEDADGADMEDEDDAESEDEAQMQEVEEVGLEDAAMGAGKALQISVSEPRDKIEKQIQPSAYRQVHSDSDYLPGDSCTSE